MRTIFIKLMRFVTADLVYFITITASGQTTNLNDPAVTIRLYLDSD
jgi:hypothetical protein